MSEFTEWDSFYLIVGSAAAALIGVQFVVISLIAERPQRSSANAGTTFLTPTIVHFCAVLLLSAIVRVPWHAIGGAAILWGLLGVCGTAYAAIIAGRMRGPTGYDPVFEDWMFHVVLPMAAYALLAISAFEALSAPRMALFGIAASSLVLLFAGIHNAWDGVSYQIFVILRREAERESARDAVPEAYGASSIEAVADTSTDTMPGTAIEPE